MPNNGEPSSIGASEDGGTGGISAGDKQWSYHGAFNSFSNFANDGTQSEFVELGGSYGDGLPFPSDGGVNIVDVITQVTLFAEAKVGGDAGYAAGEFIEIPLTKANNNRQLGTGADSFYYFIDPVAELIHVRYAGSGGATDPNDKAVMNGGVGGAGNSGKRVAFDVEAWDYFIYVEGMYTS